MLATWGLTLWNPAGIGAVSSARFARVGGSQRKSIVRVRLAGFSPAPLPTMRATRWLTSRTGR